MPYPLPPTTTRSSCVVRASFPRDRRGEENPARRVRCAAGGIVRRREGTEQGEHDGAGASNQGHALAVRVFSNTNSDRPKKATKSVRAALRRLPCTVAVESLVVANSRKLEDLLPASHYNLHNHQPLLMRCLVQRRLQYETPSSTTPYTET